MTRAITTSGEYWGGPLDGCRFAVELDTSGAPPAVQTPTVETLFDPVGDPGGTYELDGKTPAGRFRYRWTPTRAGEGCAS